MDRSLLERAKAGDRSALEQVLEELAPSVYRFGLHMCRHEADAEDVLQETLLSVMRHLTDFEGRSSLSSWVFALARSACTRRRRGLKHRQHDPLEAHAEPVTVAQSPEQAAHDAELRSALTQALDTLADDQREVVLLRDMEGMSAPEVADTLGISVAAVKSRLHRARSELRDSLRGVLERDAPPRRVDCPDVLGAFSQKLEEELSPHDCASMEAHIAGCASCNAACSALRAALWACRAESQDKVSDEVQRRIKAAVRKLLAAKP